MLQVKGETDFVAEFSKMLSTEDLGFPNLKSKANIRFLKSLVESQCMVFKIISREPTYDFQNH